MSSVAFQLTIEGAESVVWHVLSLAGEERVCAPFRFKLVVDAFTDDSRATRARLSLDALVTQKAVLTWSTGEGERTVRGIVDSVSRDATRYEIVVVPRVALLADAIDQKVFVDQDVVTVAASVLKDHGIRLDAKVKRKVQPRHQCVQAFESDLAFVTRILADEGITWFVPRGEEDRVVAFDHPDNFPKIDEPATVVGYGRVISGRAVNGAKIGSALAQEKVTLRDYNFTTPQIELEETAGSGELEEYEYPGMFEAAQEGKELAALRLEELRAREREIHAETNASDLCPGYMLSLAGAQPHVSGDWLLLEITHDAATAESGGGERYVAKITATPKDTPYRPRRSPSPRIQGVEHATTTGPGKEDLHTEQHARVKAQLRWDRRGKKDEHSSTWVRTLQPPTSGGFMLPRVGWEVLLGFVGESADRPIVLGRLSNGADRPPDAQPGHKTSSAFGSLTTPGGRTKNLVRMIDTAGAEGFDVVASKDFNERTENDKVTAVVGNDSETIGVNRTLIVGKVHGLEITGSQTHSVGADRDLSVNANMAVTTAAEAISVGAVRTFKVGGDSTIACKNLARVVAAAKLETAIEHQTRGVTGASTIAVGGSWKAVAGVHASVQVGGASKETIGGPKRITASSGYISMVKGSLTQTFASRKVEAGASHDEGFQGSATYDVSGSATLKGADVIFVAQSKITLKADGMTVEITSSGVTLRGNFQASVGAVDDGDEEYA